MEQGSDIGLGCLAHAMAKVTGHVAELESGEIVRGLKQVRWSLAEASENAGLAKHMGSADLGWLKGLRREIQRNAQGDSRSHPGISGWKGRVLASRRSRSHRDPFLIDPIRLQFIG